MTDSTDETAPVGLRGASATLVARAVAERDPLPGTRGFAGTLPNHPVDGVSVRLVRDVLGRQPLFAERDDPTTWSFDPRDLEEPNRIPAGHVRTAAGDERVWALPEPAPFDDEREAVAAVREAVETSVAEAAAAGGTEVRVGDGTVASGGDETAVAFSGGIDSAAVAGASAGGGATDDSSTDGTDTTSAGFEGPLYVAGFPDSHDVAAARDAADLLDRDIHVVELTHADLERAIPAIARATGRTNAMDVSIALPLYLVAERAAADGATRLALGQGADELFGGYAKVAQAPADPRVEADTVRGATREVMAGLPDQLERDVLAVRAAGVEPVAPLLHDRVVRAALRLPGDLLVRDGTRKYALREALRGSLPAELVGREKKAMQYGSLVSRELDRLARRAGFKRRMDDHVTEYVESMLR